MVPKRAKVITTKGAELPEVKIVDIRDSYKIPCGPKGKWEPNTQYRRIWKVRRVKYSAVTIKSPKEDTEATDKCIHIWGKVPSDDLWSECLGQQNSHVYKKDVEEGLTWKDKHLHGIHHRQTGVLDLEKTYQWSPTFFSLERKVAVVIHNITFWSNSYVRMKQHKKP